MRYSLASYILAATSDNSDIKNIFQDVTIGGEGDALSSITIQVNDKLWETESFATGAWVHNKNLSRTGTVEISISQLSDKVAKFKTFVNHFYDSSFDDSSITMTLQDSTGASIAICEDCYPTQIPSQEFGSKSTDQRWIFTCGRITFV